jgi:hypothetical protein
MRRLFIIFAKLLGLLQLYWSLVTFSQIGFGFIMLCRAEPTQAGQIRANLAGVLIYFILSLGTAWFLIFRTRWIADRLRIKDESDIAGLDKYPLLSVGIKLIGVYITAHAIPGLVKLLLETPAIWQGNIQLHVWYKMIPIILEVLIGLFLALKSNIVIKIVTRKNEKAEQPVSQQTL